MPHSIRERLLREIENVFKNATAGSTQGGTVWGRVLNTPYDGMELKGQNVISIIEGNETYLDVVSPDKRDRALEIDLQTRVYVPMGTDPRTGANSVLSDIEELVEANCLWNGLAYATFFLANSVSRENSGDRTVEISVFLSVRYRTKRSDPRA